MNRSALPAREPGREPRSSLLRAFSALNGLVLLGVLLQGLWAGEFLGGVGGADWVAVHRFTGYAVVLVAVVAAVLATVGRRQCGGAIVAWSWVLLVLLVLETALGQAISDGGERTMVAAHVPLALIVVGVGAYLSLTAARLRHRR